MGQYVILLLGLVAILAGAEFFTNGIEWAGKKLKLSDGATGSILAAVGTALPETMVPVIALAFGHGVRQQEIGVGAILGAPFMLATLALAVAGFSATLFAFTSRRTLTLQTEREVVERDLRFFIMLYTLAIGAAFIPWNPIKKGIALVLIAGYIFYVYITFRCGECQERALPPLFLSRRLPPSWLPVIGQIVLALGAIIGGAHTFVHALEDLSHSFGVSPFLLSVLITPVATELPEKFNSILWLAKRKDTLAIGNITGAMVFQSSVIPALGIMMTPWVLNSQALVTGLLALAAGGFFWLLFRRRYRVFSFELMAGVLFYAVFLSRVF